MAKRKRVQKSKSAKRLQRKAKRLLRRSHKELGKKTPDLNKVEFLLKKAATQLKRSVAQLQEELKDSKDSKQTRKEVSPIKLSYHLQKNYERHVKKFSTSSCSFTAKVGLENEVRMKDVMNSLENLFSDVISDVKNQCNLSNPSRDRMSPIT